MDTGFTKEELRTIDTLVTVFVMEYPTLTEDERVKRDEAEAATSVGGVPAVRHDNRPPAWSCDDHLALKVIRKLIADGFAVSMYGHAYGWTITLTYPATPKKGAEFLEHHASAGRMSLAICLASLNAVGIPRIPAS